MKPIHVFDPELKDVNAGMGLLTAFVLLVIYHTSHELALHLDITKFEILF